MDQSFGIKLPGLVPQYARTFRELPDLVVELEARGFDDVMDGEHILFTPVMEHPGGAGNMVHGRDSQHSDRADTMIMFAAIAARTTRIRMVSSIVLAAAHSFAVLARQAATLDLISGGRFALGVGAGWNAVEFAAQGIPPDERAARTEETMRACRELWQPGLSSFHGRWIDFDNVISEPAPVTPGGPPIWWGGNAEHAATRRRIAEFCGGWLAREAAPYDEIARSVEVIRHACEGAGRDPASVGFRSSVIPTEEWDRASSAGELVDRVVASAAKLAAVGVTHFTIPLNYFQLDLDDLTGLLTALRAA